MAYAVDPAPFARDLAEYNSDKMASKSHGRYFVTRVSVLAAILSDSILRDFCDALLDHDRGLTAAQQAALDWPGAEDQGSELLDDAAVLFNLMHVSQSLCQLERKASVVATISAAQSDAVVLAAQQSQYKGRSELSSYRSFSVRRSFMASYSNSSLVDTSWCHRSKCQPDDPWFWMWARCKLDSETPVAVHWTLQLDYMYLDPSTKPYLKPRQSPMVPRGLRCGDAGRVVLRPPDANIRRTQQLPKQQGQMRRTFKGVRHRPERKSWVAQMKPPSHKNKVWFGEFKSPEAAARAVDAAFFYFGREHHSLNFPDSALLLPPYSDCAGEPGGEVNFAAKLKFVKIQAKRLASISCSLESSTTAIHFENNTSWVSNADHAGRILPHETCSSTVINALTTHMSSTIAGDHIIPGPQTAVQPSAEATTSMMMSSASIFHDGAASRSLSQLGVVSDAEYLQDPLPHALQCSSPGLAEYGAHYIPSDGLKELDCFLDEFW